MRLQKLNNFAQNCDLFFFCTHKVLLKSVHTVNLACDGGLDEKVSGGEHGVLNLHIIIQDITVEFNISVIHHVLESLHHENLVVIQDVKSTYIKVWVLC